MNSMLKYEKKKQIKKIKKEKEEEIHVTIPMK